MLPAARIEGSGAMTAEGQDESSPVQFTGRGGELFGILFRGYVLMVPTVGIYRFWLTTWKRRFYWQNTVIDGDPLEYTGNAVQLLIGFLFALGFFLPIYIAFFYLSTQTSEIAGIGYLVIAIVFWFLMGYAAYRARDFRLSRTLWRGIRFDQRGNAWAYALRRFLWSIAMVLTLGLIYPFMAANLWRYRYTHTWFGDRQFSFHGSWKKLAGPWYVIYFGYALLIIATFIYIGGAKDYTITGPEDFPVPGPGTTAFIFFDLFMLLVAYCYWRSRSTSRMLSSVSIGDAAVTVRVRLRTLIWQYVLYGLAVAGLLVVAGIVAGGVFASLSSRGGGFDPETVSRVLQAGWTTIVLIFVVYLLVIAALGLLGEVILGYGFWRAVARGASISNAWTLKSVRASGEDRALAGEGLADALNVGSY
jgi:uncharacterized membrane protein YjgN (DUF898 family)